MNTEEIWKPIPGHDGYEASSQGRIRSIDCYVPHRNRWGTEAPMFCRGKILKPESNRNDDYLRIALGQSTPNMTVHRLVCMAFHGEPEPGQCVRHLNDVKRDNRAENLAWGTNSDNMLDSRRNGTWSNQNANATHCIHGHEFTHENTILRSRPSGGRECRKCRDERTRKWRENNLERSRQISRESKQRERIRKRKEKAAGTHGHGSTGNQ